MFKFSKDLLINGDTVTIKYNVLTGIVAVFLQGKKLKSQFLWLPFKTLEVAILGESYQLKTLLFPITKMSLHQQGVCLYADLFPKLKRYSIISFCLNLSKRLALVFAAMLA
jgi:hypothetical protein